MISVGVRHAPSGVPAAGRQGIVYLFELIFVVVVVRTCKDDTVGGGKIAQCALSGYAVDRPHAQLM